MITLSDLECDYLNATECCSRLNQWVIPKLIAHTFLSAFLLLNGHWLLMIANLPMACWMAYELATVPQGNMGVYDPTEIHNRGQLKKHMRDCMINLGYYLIFFFIYLYWCVFKYNHIMHLSVYTLFLQHDNCPFANGSDKQEGRGRTVRKRILTINWRHVWHKRTNHLYISTDLPILFINRLSLVVFIY